MPLSKPTTRLLIIAALIAATILAWAWFPTLLTPQSVYRLTPGQIPRIVTLPDQDPATIYLSVWVEQQGFQRADNATLYPVHIGRTDYCVTWAIFPPQWNAPDGFVGQLQLIEWSRIFPGGPSPMPLSPMILMNFTQTQFDAIVGRPLPQEVIDALLAAVGPHKAPPVDPIFVPWPTK